MLQCNANEFQKGKKAANKNSKSQKFSKMDPQEKKDVICANEEDVEGSDQEITLVKFSEMALLSDDDEDEDYVPGPSEDDDDNDDEGDDSDEEEDEEEGLEEETKQNAL